MRERRGNLTVLIVDDHSGFRAQARKLLEMAGYEVVGEAADAATALESARSLAPDIVVLDVQLPDRSGIDIAGDLLEHTDSVVLVSSREQSAYGDQIQESGARGFIWKGNLSAAAIAALLTEKDED